MGPERSLRGLNVQPAGLAASRPPGGLGLRIGRGCARGREIGPGSLDPASGLRREAPGQPPEAPANRPHGSDKPLLVRKVRRWPVHDAERLSRPSQQRQRLDLVGLRHHVDRLRRHRAEAAPLQKIQIAAERRRVAG